MVSICQVVASLSIERSDLLIVGYNKIFKLQIPFSLASSILMILCCDLCGLDGDFTLGNSDFDFDMTIIGFSIDVFFHY